MASATIHYFDLYARGELIRQILVHQGVEFVDHRIQFRE